MVRLLIAPDSFKGSCPAREVASALERGALKAAIAAGESLEVRCKPLSDGGEGLIDALRRSLGGELRSARVRAVDVAAVPLWRDAKWLWLPGTRTALGEAAEVVGYHATRVDTPLGRTALGIGDYLSDMRVAGAKRIVLGIGGTTTVDGGATVAQSLGGVFRSASGLIVVTTLLEAARATSFEVGSAWPGVEVICWADVITPLVGPAGAVPTYAPQKGASPEEMASLQQAVERWAALAFESTGANPAAPGTGAGGGIPYGLVLALGARIERGAANVIRLLGLAGDVEWADLVWTGEGRLDRTTLQGKLVHQVLELAASIATPAAALFGQIADVGPSDLGGVGLHALTDTGADADRCMREAQTLLETLAERVMQDWLADRAKEESVDATR